MKLRLLRTPATAPAVATLGIVVLAAVWAAPAPATGSGPAIGERERAPIGGATELQERDLAYYLSRQPPDSTAEWALLRELESVASLVEDDPARAAIALEVLLLPHEAIGDWTPLLRAAVLSEAADTAGTRRAVETLDDEWRSRWGWRLLLAAHEKAESFGTARAVAEAAAALEEAPSARATYWVHAAELSLTLGDTARAESDLWTALLLGRRSQGGREAARVLDRVAGALDAEQEIEVGLALLSAGDWVRAHARLRAHLDSPAMEDEADEARASLGRGLVELRRYSDGEALLRPLVDAGMASDAGRASNPTLEALFWTGRSAIARGTLERAAELFRRLAELAPQSTLASDALALLLEEEVKTGFGPRARGLLDEILAAGVRTTAAEAAVLRVGTTSYLEGDYATAASTFGRYVEATRRGASRQQAAWWAALANERTGARSVAETYWAQAHQISPYSFYGLTAGERTDAPVLPPGLPRGPAPFDGFDGEITNALLRLRVLRILGVSGTFDYELDRLGAHFLRRGGAYELAERLIEGGFALEGTGIGWDIQALGGGWNVRLLRIIHPFPFREFVVAQARARDLDPFIVAGLIRQESAFHAGIASSVGAMGLMQIMPATARELATGLRIQYSPEILTDPETNIRMGTTYLSQMLRMFDGQLEDALAAYNAGPGRTRQWQGLPEYRDGDVFVEWIPYEQTRNYVKLVQQHARMYTALYGCGDFDVCLGVTYQDALAMSPLTGGAGAAPGGGE